MLRRIVESPLTAALGVLVLALLVSLIFAFLVVASVTDSTTRIVLCAGGSVAIGVLASLVVGRILYPRH